MSAGIVLSCDGTRHGQPCRGALPTGALTAWSARLSPIAAAWRSIHVGGVGLEAEFIDLCPSAGHDEEPVSR